MNVYYLSLVDSLYFKGTSDGKLLLAPRIEESTNFKSFEAVKAKRNELFKEFGVEFDVFEVKISILKLQEMKRG